MERRIREIGETRVGFGYRRVHVLLEREGWDNNIKRPIDLQGLGPATQEKDTKHRVKAKLREDRRVAVGPNDVWAMDFVYNQLATGKKLRVLMIVDKFSRYVPVLDPRRGTAISVKTSVVQTLERTCGKVGYPRASVSIRGPSSCHAIWTSGPMPRAWPWTSRALASRPTMHFIEAFNGRFRSTPQPTATKDAATENRWSQLKTEYNLGQGQSEHPEALG